MSSPIVTDQHVGAVKYVPVHMRSPSSTPSPMRQTPVSDANDRRKFVHGWRSRRVLMRSPEIPAPVYSIEELLDLSKSPLVQTSLTSEKKQEIADIMARIPRSKGQLKGRPSSPTKSKGSPSPTTKSNRTSSPTKKVNKSPLPENVSLPMADTPSILPRRISSKRRLAETTSNSNPDSGHQQRASGHWGYASSFHHNEANWRDHPSLAAIAARSPSLIVHL